MRPAPSLNTWHELAPTQIWTLPNLSGFIPWLTEKSESSGRTSPGTTSTAGSRAMPCRMSQAGVCFYKLDQLVVPANDKGASCHVGRRRPVTSQYSTYSMMSCTHFLPESLLVRSWWRRGDSYPGLDESSCGSSTSLAAPLPSAFWNKTNLSDISTGVLLFCSLVT